MAERLSFEQRKAVWWIGRRGAIEYSPRPQDLTPLDFYLWETLKDEVYRQKPATLNALRETIEASCAAIAPDTLTAVVRSAVRRHRRCLAADGGHTYNDSLSLRARIVTTCHFVPKILTIKEWVHFFGPLCIRSWCLLWFLCHLPSGVPTFSPSSAYILQFKVRGLIS
jgi:hypothetical protein